jgi:hypothetical protein
VWRRRCRWKRCHCFFRRNHQQHRCYDADRRGQCFRNWLYVYGLSGQQ